MSSQRQNILRAEEEFLSGVVSNFKQAQGGLFRGSHFKAADQDELDRLRRIMLEHKVYDRQRMLSLPHNRRHVVHGYDRRWWFLPSRLGRLKAFRKHTGVAIGSVLTPLRHFVQHGEDSGEAPPIDSTELMKHVRSLISGWTVPHLIGVCSPTGFTNDARKAALDLPNVTLVLVEPKADGSWQTHAIGDEATPEICKLFDPETQTEKVDRVRQAIDERRADLLSGGLSASAMAERLSLAVEIVSEGFRRAAIKDPELRISSRSGTMVLYRAGPAGTQERPKMSVLDRIRQLFEKEGGERQKIEMFTEQRAHLAERRDRLYADIGKLETRESDLVAEGKSNSSKVVRRRLAAQIMQVRKDIVRQNTTANMLNQQIDIISTRIHNLTLIQQGQMAQIPSAEELTQEAVEAEELLEQLKADSDLVAGLETGLSETLTSQEEMDILKEFEEADEPVAPVKTKPVAGAPAAEPDSAAISEAFGDEPDTPQERGEAEPN